jgi:hypothetical protein
MLIMWALHEENRAGSRELCPKLERRQLIKNGSNPGNVTSGFAYNKMIIGSNTQYHNFSILFLSTSIK